MITRAQAEALLTLAESLEACEKLDIRFRPGTLVTWLHRPGEHCALEDGVSGMSLRLYVNERVPKQET
jgi:hypothetical protein